LWIRRKRFILRFATKAAANPTNPARTITEMHWKTAYGRFAIGKEPIYTVIQDFVMGRPTEPQGPRRKVLPPWHVTPPPIDDSLRKRVTKKEDPIELLHALAAE